MAQCSDVEARLCLVWCTERPFMDRPRKSSNFPLLNCEWNLQFCFDSRSNNYTISLQQGMKSEKLNEPFRVTTWVENKKNCTIPYLHRQQDVRSTNEKLLQFENRITSNNIRNFSEYAEWKIVLIFHDIPKNETVHLSTQTDLKFLATDNVPPGLESLSLDLYNLLKYEVFPDVSFRCAGRTFSAHRAILAARSQVFACMFQNNIAQSETGVIDVTDLEAETLALLLNYAYSGKIADLSEDNALRVYSAGHKYATRGLRKTCSDWMIGNLTQENCIGFLAAADAHGDIAFKDSVASFIVRQPSVLESEKWLRFTEEHSKLANEVYQRFVAAVHVQ